MRGESGRSVLITRVEYTMCNDSLVCDPCRSTVAAHSSRKVDGETVPATLQRSVSRRVYRPGSHHLCWRNESVASLTLPAWRVCLSGLQIYVMVTSFVIY